jgi:hypothetical protein
LHGQAQAGEGDERGAPPAVPVTVPDEQPRHASEEDREMQRVVVKVEGLDE